jgi:uncharacterized RDD family membrane protein YckC
MATALTRASTLTPSPSPRLSPTVTPSADRQAEPLDTTVRLITPERIVFHYPLAGPFRRLFAYFLDQVAIWVLLFAVIIVSMMVSLGSGAWLGLVLVAYFLLSWGYQMCLEAMFNGQTLGKRALRLRVVSDQGVPITAAQAVVRNLVGAAEGLVPFFYLLALASMVLTKKFQRLGDLAAGTMVIVEDRPWRVGVLSVKEKAVEELLPWLPVRISAGQEMARALSDYVKRRSRFSPPLRQEMAEPLARPLRKLYGLPADASSDAVLCAVYHRVFLGE